MRQMRSGARRFRAVSVLSYDWDVWTIGYCRLTELWLSNFLFHTPKSEKENRSTASPVNENIMEPDCPTCVTYGYR